MFLLNKIRIHLLITCCIFILIEGCKKKEEEVPAIEFGSVTDVSGITYKTVKIGNQWWMAEDLRTTKYQDSSFISLVAGPPDTTWSTYTSGAYTNNVNSQGVSIGKFYNWYAVNDVRGIAPKGWHVPSDAEWKELEQHLGMNAAEADKMGWRGTHEGEKLKVIRGTDGGWSDYGNVWSTNESGFSAYPYGCRMFDGSFGDPGQSATEFWWTLSQEGHQAWYRYLDYKNADVFRYYGPKTYGFSVRCVKD